MADDPARASGCRCPVGRVGGPARASPRSACEVAELAADLACRGRRSLEGDATAGALLAEAATRAAARLVELNLAGQPGDARVGAAREHAARARAARSELRLD